MATMEKEMSIKEWSEVSGINPDTARKKATRFYGTSFGITSVLSDKEWQVLYPSGGRPNKEKAVRLKVYKGPEKSAKAKPGRFSRFINIRSGVLVATMAMPAVASLQNIQSVTLDITGHVFTATVLTGVFSLSPFLIVLAGMRTNLSRALALVLILYECFCNFTRIYGGLTGFGRNGYPTRFLGLVTDIFGTATHGTAIVISAFMALMAGAIFYTAYHELNK